MILSETYKYVYLPTPRCASTTIAKVLEEYDPIYLGQKHEISPIEDWYQDKYVFTVCRNPFDRLVSIFEYMRSGGMGPLIKEKTHTEIEFLDFYCKKRKRPNIIFASQKEFMAQCPVEFRIIKFENLTKAWWRLPFTNKAIADTLPHLNGTIKYKTRYFEDYRHIVDDIIAEDCEYLRYPL